MKRIREFLFRPKKNGDWDEFTSRHYDDTAISRLPTDAEDDEDGVFTSWRQYILS
jgi:hypothetical protein